VISFSRAWFRRIAFAQGSLCAEVKSRADAIEDRSTVHALDEDTGRPPASKEAAAFSVA